MKRLKLYLGKIINITYWFSIYKFIILCLRNGSNSKPPDLNELLSKDGCQNLKISESTSINKILSDVIFTTNQGIFVTSFSNQNFTKLLKGKFYGITKYQDYWIFSRSNNFTPSKVSNDKSRRQSDICAIKFIDDKIEEYFVLLWGIPGEIHQIDVFNDKVNMPHTGFNQVLSISLSKLFKNGKPIQKPLTIFSCDSIEFKIKSPSHLNSIFYSNKTGITYIVAHNSTAHSDRTSEILLVSNDSNKITVRETKAHSAHNVCELGGKLIYCDSNNWKLMLENDCIFKAKNKLLRGLSITDDLIFVGGSDVDFTGKNREKSNCDIFILDHSGNLFMRFEFLGIGNIMEIRQLSIRDYAMS